MLNIIILVGMGGFVYYLDVMTQTPSQFFIFLDFRMSHRSMYIFARTKSSINTSILSEKLLEQGLAIAPGIGFGDYNEFFRISACIEKESIIEGLNILSSEINK